MFALYIAALAVQICCFCVVVYNKWVHKSRRVDNSIINTVKCKITAVYLQVITALWLVESVWNDEWLYLLVGSVTVHHSVLVSMCRIAVIARGYTIALLLRLYLLLYCRFGLLSFYCDWERLRSWHWVVLSFRINLVLNFILAAELNLNTRSGFKRMLR